MEKWDPFQIHRNIQKLNKNGSSNISKEFTVPISMRQTLETLSKINYVRLDILCEGKSKEPFNQRTSTMIQNWKFTFKISNSNGISVNDKAEKEWSTKKWPKTEMLSFKVGKSILWIIQWDRNNRIRKHWHRQNRHTYPNYYYRNVSKSHWLCFFLLLLSSSSVTLCSNSNMAFASVEPSESMYNVQITYQWAIGIM